MGGSSIIEGGLVENSVLLIDFSTDSGRKKPVAVNLYIPMDTAFQNLQKHIFLKYNKYRPPEKYQAHYSLDTILCVFGLYSADFYS
jgi:hypothetical protein